MREILQPCYIAPEFSVLGGPAFAFAGARSRANGSGCRVEDLHGQGMQNAQIFIIQFHALDAAEMQVERAHRCRPVIQRITNQAQGQPGIEAGRNFNIGIPGPQSESRFGQALPWKFAARVHLAHRSEIGVTDNLRTRDGIAFAQVFQQHQQAVDLRGGKGIDAVVVQFDTNGNAVDIGEPVPTAGPACQARSLSATSW